MRIHSGKIVVLGVMALVSAAISLPAVSFAAVSPVVTVLSPMTQGLRAPVKMVLDADGNSYVTDQRVGGVVKLNKYGVQVAVIYTVASPGGVALAQDGTLLVSHGTFVSRYDKVTGQEIVTGRLVGGDLKKAAGIAVDDVTGYIYVADSGANRVVVYTAAGVYVSAFAQGVTADASGITVINPDGKLSGPAGIAFEKVARQIAVADTLSHKVQFFDLNGNFVKSIGNPISATTGATVGVMQFDAPTAVSFEYANGALNRMYVVDAFQGRVQVVDPTTSAAIYVSGTTKNYIGSVGALNGQLTVPSDVVFDAANRRLMVVNGYGNITNYGIDGGSNPVDVEPPAFAIDPAPVAVSVDNVTIGGSVEVGSTVVVASGSRVVQAVVSGSVWKANVAGLVAGDNVISVSAKDAAGNIAAAQVLNVYYQLPAPLLVVSPSISLLTNSREVILGGTVEAGASVVVANESGVLGDASVVDGVWSYQVLLKSDSANVFAVTAQKPMSAKAVATITVTQDSIPPALSVSTLSDGSYTSTQIQNIAGNVGDAKSLLINNEPAVVIDGSFSVPFSLVPGANAITIVASDAAGNVSADSRVLYFDSSKPQISVSYPVDNSFVNSAGLQMNGSVDKRSTVVVGGVVVNVDSNNNWTSYVRLQPGLNTVEVVATDLYGNASSLKRTVVLDDVSPILSVESPSADRAVNQSSVIVSGAVDDGNIASVLCSVAGQDTPLAVESGKYSIKVDFAKEGVYPIAVTAVDLAGNKTIATRSLIYDITPPLLALDAVKWQAHALGGKISGTVEAGGTVVVKESGVKVGSVAVNGTKWSADLTGISYNQTKITVEATDAAGNVTSIPLKSN